MINIHKRTTRPYPVDCSSFGSSVWCCVGGWIFFCDRVGKDLREASDCEDTYVLVKRQEVSYEPLCR